MTRRKAFVILTPGFPESESDTTCLPAQQSFVRTLNQLNPELIIIVLTFQYPYHAKPYTWFGLQVIPFNGRNKGGLTKLSLRRKINSTLRKINATHIITGLLSFWSNECAWIGKKFAGVHGLKHCCWILGQDARKENLYPQKLHFHPEELIALSDFLQDEFEQNHGVRPQFVIPAGIAQAAHPSKVKDIDLLAAGSLIPLKQYEIFLHVVANVKKREAGVKALLIGEGPEKKKLQSLANRLRLETALDFAGELPHAQVLQAMERTKVFLHPSSYEGFSGVCLEALASGAHVISFCKPMHHDIDHWHIVTTGQHMTAIALELLKDPLTKYEPVIPFRMEDTVRGIIGLFQEAFEF